DPAQHPDHRHHDQRHDPRVRDQERRHQEADDEEQLAARIEPMDERIARRELVQELHRPSLASSASRASGTVIGSGSSPSRSASRHTGGGLIALVASSSASRNTARGAPSASTWPWCSTIIRAQYSATSSITCVIATIVVPRSRRSAASKSMISRALRGSWPVVGSSTISTSGASTRIAAI